MTSDAQPRTKNGQPAQSTTGVASSELEPVRRSAGRRACVQAGQMAAHLQHEHRQRQRQADPEPARHVDELGVRARRRPSPSPARAPCRRSGRCRARPAGSRGASGRCRSCPRARLSARSGVGIEIACAGRPRTSPGSRPSRNGSGCPGTPPCALAGYRTSCRRQGRSPTFVKMTMGRTGHAG